MYTLLTPISHTNLTAGNDTRSYCQVVVDDDGDFGDDDTRPARSSEASCSMYAGFHRLLVLSSELTGSPFRVSKTGLGKVLNVLPNDVYPSSYKLQYGIPYGSPHRTLCDVFSMLSSAKAKMGHRKKDQTS